MKTPITYYGGKQTMLKHILPLIPPHDVYTEAFCGGAAVLFAKQPVRCEVINDLDRSLVNFFRVSKTDYDALKREIDATLHCRDQHTHARHIMNHPQFFSPVQWAWAVWVVSKMSFASKMDGHFGYDRGNKTPNRIKNASDDFTEELCGRLRNVTIEHDDAMKVIARYDTSEAFHFVDPPYVNSNCGHFSGMFTDADMVALIDLLAGIKGKFMLTMFPYDPIEQAAKSHEWVIHRVERTIRAAREGCRRQEEWMVCNY